MEAYRPNNWEAWSGPLAVDAAPPRAMKGLSQAVGGTAQGVGSAASGVGAGVGSAAKGAGERL